MAIGLPYINMISTANMKSEKEILLPRNIIFKLVKISKNEITIKNYGTKNDTYTHDIYHVEAYPMKKDQFKIKTGCKNYDIATIKSLDSEKLLEELDIENNNIAGQAVEEELQIIPHMLKNCIKIGNRCKSHDGPMDSDCELSEKGRCIVKKKTIKKTKQVEIDNVKIIKKDTKKKNKNKYQCSIINKEKFFIVQSLDTKQFKEDLKKLGGKIQ